MINIIKEDLTIKETLKKYLELFVVFVILNMKSRKIQIIKNLQS